jgi:hypothetical protein
MLEIASLSNKQGDECASKTKIWDFDVWGAAFSQSKLFEYDRPE